MVIKFNIDKCLQNGAEGQILHPRHFLRMNYKQSWHLMIALCIKRLLCNETMMVINQFCTTATVWSPNKHTRDEYDDTNVCEIGTIKIILKIQDFSVNTISLRATSQYLLSSICKDRIFLTVKYSSTLKAKIFRVMASTSMCTLYKWSWIQFRTTERLS